MTRLDIAEQALNAVFQLERSGGTTATPLTDAMRIVLAAFICDHFSCLRNDLYVFARSEGLSPLTHGMVADIRAQGLDRMRNPIIARAMAQIQKAQKRSA